MGERVVSWADGILGDVDLGDRRMERRVGQLIDDWCQQPGASIPQVGGNWAGSMGAYRLFANPAVERERIIAALAERTAERCADYARVLVVQDTTSLDYSRHAHTTGLGILDTSSHHG